MSNKKSNIGTKFFITYIVICIGAIAVNEYIGIVHKESLSKSFHNNKNIICTPQYQGVEYRVNKTNGWIITTNGYFQKNEILLDIQKCEVEE